MGGSETDGSPAQRWTPTAAYERAAIVGLGLLVAGVALGRPDAVVLATPLVVIAAWAGLRRPRHLPRAEATSGTLTVHEGQDFAWSAHVHGAVGRIAAVHPGQRLLEVDPPAGVVRRIGAGDVGEVRFTLRATRWGRRELGRPAVAAYDAWGAWRWGPVELPALRLVVLPGPAPQEARAPAPHPRGLVGQERASRPGEGTEFAKVRPFQAGDRLRRIHWPVSARTGTLHVSATHGDEDARVALLIDALNDVGESGGLGGEASSMDLTVRAVALVAEHFIRRGDRVGLRIFGAWGVNMLPTTMGRVQLRRVLDALSLIEPGTAQGEVALSARQGLGAGTLVMLFSPLIEATAAQQVGVLMRAGLDVVVIDTLPSDTASAGSDPAALAWRLRMLERRLELDRLASLGIPVVSWTGAHSLDQVLRDVGRRSTRPRVVPR